MRRSREALLTGRCGIRRSSRLPPARQTADSMRVGLSIDPPRATIPGVLAEEGVDTFQTVLRDPGRFGNYGVPDPADRAALIEGLRGRGTWGVAHGSLLITLA